MSLTSYAEESRINPLDVVERLATGNDWSFERASDDDRDRHPTQRREHVVTPGAALVWTRAMRREERRGDFR